MAQGGCTPKTVLLLLTLWSGLLAPALAANDRGSGQPVAVTVAPVREQTPPAHVELPGTVQAVDRAAIAARVTGVITRMPVALGTAVKAGDPLVTISAEELAARVQQGEAQLAQAKRNLEREQNLLARNAATPETVRTLTEQYALAQAALREATTMLGYTTINAPFDGVVTGKNASTGDLAVPGAVLLRLEGNRAFQVRMAVPESLALALDTGDTLPVKVDATGATVQGRVAEIAPAADPRTRTSQMLLDLPFTPSLRAGQFARVLLPGKGGNTLLIPHTALVPFGQMDRVFVVEEGRARLRLVRTGPRHDDMTEILAGLGAGEIVVTGNNRLLVDGQALRVEP